MVVSVGKVADLQRVGMLSSIGYIEVIFRLFKNCCIIHPLGMVLADVGYFEARSSVTKCIFWLRWKNDLNPASPHLLFQQFVKHFYLSSLLWIWSMHGRYLDPCFCHHKLDIVLSYDSVGEFLAWWWSKKFSLLQWLISSSAGYSITCMVRWLAVAFGVPVGLLSSQFSTVVETLATCLLGLVDGRQSPPALQ